MQKRKPYKRKCPRERYEPREHGHGFVLFMDKRKLKNDGWDDQIEPEVRKPTPAEREEIVLNYIKTNSGKAIAVFLLAFKLGVTDRTIQKILQKFEANGLIKRTCNFNYQNRQRANIIEFISTDKTISHCTLENLYDADNPYGFRDWDWDDYKIIVGYYTEDFTKEDARRHYEWLQDDRKRLQEKREKLLNEGKKENPKK